MGVHDRVSTGRKGFDDVVDMLRLGDNVVWQVQSIEDYRYVIEPYIRQACEDERKIIYFRFGAHPPLFGAHDPVHIHLIDASNGFESFAVQIHNLIEEEGERAFYVFDCLTDLLEFWNSDLMIGNFFRVTCPFLYELDTVAYFAIIHNAHTYSTIARIRETTQLLLNLYCIDGNVYFHPLKVQDRYSPTMFLPHLVNDDEAVCITASAEAAELFSYLDWGGGLQTDHWEMTFTKAREILSEKEEVQEDTKRKLLELLVGKKSRIFDLCQKYFTLQDILTISAREVGSGFIGGKAVGMLLARKILKTEAWDLLHTNWEAHDSYYLGTDIFYTYIVQNGWWQLWTKQKSREGYFKYAPDLQKNLLMGKFPDKIQEQFTRMLEHYGQSPIIVRSSSLLEDNFGNAFAGKYDSVFCPNQGTPEERYQAFEEAVRTVYASTMNEDALTYRLNRGLFDKDEQMAILVQRVSGDYHEDNYFPHVAGVGNSSNLYVWDKDIDMSAGMLRLVFGLGTRAVDRIHGDYARIVALDAPTKMPPVCYGDEKKFSQHKVDVLNLRENELKEVSVETITKYDIKVDKSMFFSIDTATQTRLRELGRNNYPVPYMLDFKKLLASTFPELMKMILATLSAAYQYPVDIEFTANYAKDNTFKINLLQCRPLQTRGLGKPAKTPVLKNQSECFFSSCGNFMGGNVFLPINYVIFVKAKEYLELSEQEKFSVARLIGKLNNILAKKNALLIGPGRWGTSTPSLGVPVHFTELCHMAAICEVSYREGGLMPELSYGSHFFQDIVESGIFYTAIFDDAKDTTFRPQHILGQENILHTLVEEKDVLADVVHVVKSEGLNLYSDIVSQKLLCYQANTII